MTGKGVLEKYGGSKSARVNISAFDMQDCGISTFKVPQGDLHEMVAEYLEEESTKIMRYQLQPTRSKYDGLAEIFYIIQYGASMEKHPLFLLKEHTGDVDLPSIKFLTNKNAFLKTRDIATLDAEYLNVKTIREHINDLVCMVKRAPETFCALDFMAKYNEMLKAIDSLILQFDAR